MRTFGQAVSPIINTQQDEPFNFDKEEPCFKLAHQGKLEELQNLIAVDPVVILEKASNTANLLMFAANAGRLNIIKYILNFDYDTFAESSCSSSSSSNIDSNNIKCLAIVNHKDQDGWTALMYASRDGNLEIVMALLKAGADINCKHNVFTRNGKSSKRLNALALATQVNNLAIVKLILERKPDSCQDAYNIAIANEPLILIAASIYNYCQYDDDSPVVLLDTHDLQCLKQIHIIEIIKFRNMCEQLPAHKFSRALFQYMSNFLEDCLEKSQKDRLYEYSHLQRQYFQIRYHNPQTVGEVTLVSRAEIPALEDIKKLQYFIDSAKKKIGVNIAEQQLKSSSSSSSNSSNPSTFFKDPSSSGKIGDKRVREDKDADDDANKRSKITPSAPT